MLITNDTHRRLHQGRLSIHRLTAQKHSGDGYEEADSSLHFPDFPVQELARFVELFLQGELGKNQILRLFREWVREQLGR